MPGYDTPVFFTMIKDNWQLILLEIPAPYTGVYKLFNPVIFCSYSCIEAFFVVPEKKFLGDVLGPFSSVKPTNLQCLRKMPQHMPSRNDEF